MNDIQQDLTNNAHCSTESFANIRLEYKLPCTLCRLLLMCIPCEGRGFLLLIALVLHRISADTQHHAYFLGVHIFRTFYKISDNKITISKDNAGMTQNERAPCEIS